ncbi:MAG TPA: hypothetical protein VFL15_05825 [Gammaproteobacteria bacterium]|nr:hypothetical protein [Gammaproteobacteria bacterium]
MSNPARPRQRYPVGHVLVVGWRLFVAGLVQVFPLVLVAEIIAALPVAGAGGGLFSTDLDRLVQPGYLAWTLLSVVLQTVLYASAVLRLARLENNSTKVSWRAAAGAIPGLLIGYVVYDVLVVCGLGISLLLFVLVALLFGIIPALIVALIPLAATAWLSTALAFFAYPAVLEQAGPFAALGRSLRLARSNWAHAALVVSVPAVGLLAVAALQDTMPVLHSVHAVMNALSQLSSQPTADQLQNLLANPATTSPAGAHPLWQMTTAVLSALAWWYALAVCYAEFMLLKQSAVLTAR